jgi:hypothetical protein
LSKMISGFFPYEGSTQADITPSLLTKTTIYVMWHFNARTIQVFASVDLL